MGKSTTDLMQIAELGANLMIDASTKSTEDLIKIVSFVGNKGGHLTLLNCNLKPIEDLKQILGVYSKNITLDFSESYQV